MFRPNCKAICRLIFEQVECTLDNVSFSLSLSVVIFSSYLFMFSFTLLFTFSVEVNIQIRLLAVILRILDLIFGGGKRLLFSTASKMSLEPVSFLFREKNRVFPP